MKPNKLSFTLLALILPVISVQALIFGFADLSPSALAVFGGRFLTWLAVATSFSVSILALHFYSNHWLRKHRYIR